MYFLILNNFREGAHIASKIHTHTQIIYLKSKWVAMLLKNC